MKRVYITFSGAAYNRTTKHIVDRAVNMGASDLWVYDDAWLMQQEFYKVNYEWWQKPDTRHGLPNRGFGWFIWKPFIMMHALSRCADGDVVLFTDGDTFPVEHFGQLYDRCKQDGGIMLFEAQGCDHRNWCKRDTFIVMGQDSPGYYNRPHAVARFYLFERGPWLPQQFLAEWLAYCLNPSANTFDASRIAGEQPDLHEPRCEQAILTNLAHKYRLKLYREACQAGNGALQAYGTDGDLYLQLFEQFDEQGDKSNLSGSPFRSVPA